MPRVALTDLFVRSARSDAQCDFWDLKTPGFGLRVGKHSKAFVAKLDNRRITIGSYPELSLADARKKFFGLKAEERKPNEKRTFSDAYRAFQDSLTGKKPRTVRDYKRLLSKYFEPKLGSNRLSEIAYGDVVAITEPLATSEGAHALAVARTFFRWCVKPPRRWIPYSPLEGVSVTVGKKRKRVLKHKEVRAVWNAAIKQGYPHGTVVQLLLLTGQRRTEIVSLRRPWIDEKEKTITLPDWLTKNKKEHTFPYGSMVAEILDGIPRFNATELLFPSRISGERPFSGWSKYKKQMTDGVPGWTLHDLRRTYRTMHGEIGTSSAIGERLINHVAAVTTDVERIYDQHTYLKEMRAAVQNYEQHLVQILASSQ